MIKFVLAIALALVLPFAADAQYLTSGYSGNMTVRSVTIANAGTKTAAIDLKGFTLVGVQTPAALTGTALTFEASSAIDGTFVPVYDSSGAVSYTVAASRYVAINPLQVQGIRFIKLVSGSSEAAQRTLILYMKGF